MRKPGRKTATTEHLALPMTVPYDNRGLFADNYLRSRMSDLADWRETPGLDDVFEAIKKLYGETREALADSNEAQTEADFIRPILDLLWVDDGKCWDVQVHIPALGERGKHPDYAFFRTAADRSAAGPRKGTQEYFRDVPCLGDAKGWSISLDKDRAGGGTPSAQMSEYLYRSRVRWGILTNGQLWRLYEQDKSRAGGVFFQVDLQSVLEHNDRAAFRWFYAFFRRDAFAPDTDGKTFVDKVFQGSVDYATGVGDRLKDSIYDALRILMNGFLDRASNHLDRHDEVTLRTVHDNTLILLYRLLFVLYAEDRELLPLRNEDYQTYALVNTHRKVNSKLRAGKSYPRQTSGLWADLLNLFLLIDEPDPASEIPAYNGGLFNPAKHPHIAHTPQPDCVRWDIGDDALAQAIDMLAYERDRWDEPGSQDVDYKSLDVQHLGSIYEGLLELQPEVAKVPLVEVSEKGKSGFEPEDKVKKPAKVRGQTPRRVPKDAVYLVTDRGERKATGSYYTPKYIVDYIVDNTVGPLADEAGSKVAQMRAEVDSRIAKLENTIREWEKCDPRDESTQLQIKELRREADKERRKLLEPYLSLAILDPAMGSGHFLVGAADFLSLAMATDPNLLPLEANGAEDEQAYYKRLVVEHCLYGVDLNPLAVELAKLSLWLHTVSKDKALSFLDHHLRCGNSLIGASVDNDLTREPPQLNGKGKLVNGSSSQLILGFSDALTATHLQSFLDIFKEISESTGGTVEIERHKAEIYEKMDEVRDRFRAVANCWLAPYFGQPVSPKQYERAVDALKDANKWESLKAESWFRRSRRLVVPKRPFHWELEFPERFFSRGGLKADADQGFDAVMGNPPYIRVRKLKETNADEAQYYESGRYACATHVWDVHMLVMERSAALVRSNGCCSFIAPIQTLHQPNAAALREMLVKKCVLSAVLDLSSVAVFEAAIVKCCIVTWRSAYPSADCAVSVYVGDPRNPGAMHATEVPQSVFLAREAYSLKTDGLGPVGDVLAKIDGLSVGLSSLFYPTFGLRSCARGKGAGDKSRLVTMDEAAPAAVPYMEGRETDRYEKNWRGRYLRYLPDDMYSPRTPALFEQPKVLCQSMLSAKRLVATYDGDGLYVEQSLVCIVPHGTLTPGLDPPCQLSLPFLLSLVNSRLLSFYFAGRIIGDSLGGGLIHATPGSLARLPICRIAFSTPETERQRLNAEIRTGYHEGVHLESVLDRAQDLLATGHGDVVHDILAFLAGEMIDLNKSKQEEVKGFLTWLAGYIGCAIEELTNKTKVKEYHGSDFDSLAAVLAQNSKRLTVSPEARATIETIKPEFEKSIAKLEPLKARIAATDDLIDQIVYKLYGLTEDEIRIVKRECEPTEAD